jgi:steroid delta-isomerase-like uncharacterized protein
MPVDKAQTAADVIQAFNTGNWERLRAIFTPDIVYQETGTQRHTEGVEPYIEVLQGWRHALPDCTGTIHVSAMNDTAATHELTWQATHTGPLETPNGTLPPTGKRITVQAALWYIFDGDHIREIHHHLDVLSLLHQLGALSSPS